MRSITNKLMLAILTVTLVTITLVIFLTYRFTNKEVRDFYIGQSIGALADELEEYYQINGSWQGINLQLPILLTNNFPEQAGVNEQALVILLDNKGNLVHPRSLSLSALQLLRQEQKNGLWLQSNGERIGILVFIDKNFNWDIRAPIFLANINRLLILFSMGGLVMAIILGAIIARTMARPIRELTAATKAAAAGDLSYQVEVHSDDELGELAQSFNTMNSQLDRLINARKQMTADIAHELRTPISIILGHTDGVRDGVIPMSTETFDVIAEEAERLNNLVEDLHTLSRADAGELPMTFIDVSLKELISDLHLPQIQAMQAKPLQLTSDIFPEDLTLHADPDRLIQVLRNLLNNAIHYTPENGSISIIARAIPGSRVRIYVNDSGPGVSDDELEQIFNRFYRSDASRIRDGEGSGLGLAIARSIVERHEGKIWAENRPTGGLSVVIELPMITGSNKKVQD